LPTPFGPQLLCEKWGKSCFPLSNGLIGEHPSSFQEHLSEISQTQFLSKPPEDNQKDHIGGIFQEVERRACTLVEETLASGATKQTIAKRGLLGLFFDRS